MTSLLSTGAREGQRMKDRRVLVVGLGVSGSAACGLLQERGAKVLAVDSAREVRADAAGPGVEVCAGADLDDPTLLDGIELVVTSPGVPPVTGVLAAAVSRGVPVWSEPELGWRLNGGQTRLVGVTGTNGKTTTTELLAACLGASTAGNIGPPLSSLLGAEQPPPLVAAELSSFQLHFAPGLRTSVGVLLNLAPDHLDWHQSFEAYADAKARVWANQGTDGVTVVNADDEAAMALCARRPPPGHIVRFRAGAPRHGEVGVRAGALTAYLGGEPVEVAALEALPLRGPHNVANACAATAAALAGGASVARVAAALAGYRTGPHRLEHVATIAGVAWVNDSKATNPHAAAAALSSYPSVVWIAGGLDKGLDFGPLARKLAGRARAAVTVGSSGSQVAAVARTAGVPTVEAGTLEAAVPIAASLARPGDTVLLAPACASMDQFADYAHRGQVFRDAVAGLAAARGEGARPLPTGGAGVR